MYMSLRRKQIYLDPENENAVFVDTVK